MKLQINTSERTRTIHNFWNHIHFHPTDAIEDDWGQRILNRIHEDGIAGTVRMYTMLEDVVTIAADGTLQYDFTENDIRMDYMVGKGFNLLLSYNYIPACIASDPNETSSQSKNTTRYKGKLIITSPPKDYALWEEICRVYTDHIVKRYGLPCVSKWYLQCYNEPDIPPYWMKNEPDMQKRAAEYCRLYDAFERGIRSVSEDLCIGGPTLAGHLDFFEYFLRHIRDNKRQLNFICFHTYGTSPSMINSKELPINAANSVDRIMKCSSLARQYGFGDRPLIIDEWGASSCGFFNMEECPELIFRENEVYSAYFIKMITLYEKLQLPIDKLMICLSGQHEMKTDFSGFRGFFTLNFYPKPIYNAYVLAAKLGSQKLAYTAAENDNLSVLPAISEDGRITVLLSYSSADFSEELPDLPLDIQFTGISSLREAKLWRIDREHANAYRAYERLGAPNQPTAKQICDITAAGTLTAESCSFKESLHLIMQNNSVVLVEIG